jgi:hypothetical protein
LKFDAKKKNNPIVDEGEKSPRPGAGTVELATNKWVISKAH